MRLANTTTAFNLTSSVKGYFPHHFNRVENDSYVRPYPAKEFYGDNSKLYHKTTEGEVTRYVDFTSLYPFCQATKCFPIGHPQLIFKDFDNLENYYGLVKATVLPPRKLLHPVLPYRANKK